MNRTKLEAAIEARGRAFFAGIRGEKPSIFNRDWWTGKVLDLAMRDEEFKVRLFRFVDVLPVLRSDESLARHIHEYFDDCGSDSLLGWSMKCASLFGRTGEGFVGSTLRRNIETMARGFIIGETLEEAVAGIRRLRAENFAFTVDILGEAAVSEAEAERYRAAYHDLLDTLDREQGNWQSLGGGATPHDWGAAPRINIAVKPTSLFSQADPADFDNTVGSMYGHILPLARHARNVGAFLCLDMEQHRYKDITLAVYRKLREAEEFADWPHQGVVLQAYLRETEADCENLLGWARAAHRQISIRLVKGAYWDYENIVAGQNGWQSPVFQEKHQSDAAFERLAEKILAHHSLCHLACASHNIRSLSAVMEMAAALGVPEERYEFQVLYGMAGPVRRGLRKVAGRVRLYCPYGEMLPGMGYLVRRLLENTANESFLRQSFVDQADTEELLADPARLAAAIPQDAAPDQSATDNDRPLPFRNQPQPDFTRPEERLALAEALKLARGQLGRRYPLLVNGEEIFSKDTLDSLNPANPQEVVGTVSLADAGLLDRAVGAAAAAQSAWEDRSARERAGFLFRAAAIARKRLAELAAWQILEVGKQWDQAVADVAEAIDFLEYYGREMIRLAAGRPLGQAPGEENRYLYRAKGVAAVIAPWNFPLAISCGMCAAALAAGNTVVYKPAGLSAVSGFLLADLFRQAGLPPGVFHFVPCRGGSLGDHLVDHPQVQVVAFTGSLEVGQRIAGRAARPAPGQFHMKRVIAEMGGKNAIIIDDDADLDQAVPAVLASAFRFQGQKCSACSRVIVLDGIYERFVTRLVEAATSLSTGPAEDPAHFMGPVVDESARQKISSAIDTALTEGSLLFKGSIPEPNGYYVSMCIVGDIRPEHRTAQEEIFGPVLAVMRAADFDDALRQANSTAFALTGGVFSRSPARLEEARRRFRVGNLYLNRGITGALVHRQPFGGFKLSGVGSKAGGPDYLLQFLDPVCVTENTVRRGFAPESGEA